MSAKKKFEIHATKRADIGKGASRRLRREEKIPGILYGAGKEAISVIFEHNHLSKALQNESFYSKILTLNLDSMPEQVILKDVQRHPYKARLLHLDFQRVRADEKLVMNIPLHFLGGDKAPGVKDGGLVSHIESDVEVSCLPADLPEYLELDISEMGLNDIMHLSDLKLPQGVELVALTHGDDKSIVSIHMPRVEEEPVEAPEPIAPSEVPAMEQKGDEPKPEDENKK